MSVENTAVLDAEQAVLGELERARLVELEGVVERGIRTFVAVGRALTAIKDERLYRAEYRNWPTYVVERWQLSEGRACQLMQGAAVEGAITSGGGELPATLSDQALRQFVPLLAARGPDAVASAWALVRCRINGSPLTGPSVRRVLDAEGLPVYGKATGRSHRPRLDQLGALLGQARARVDRLQEQQRDRDLDAVEIGRLAGACREMAALLDALAGVTPEPGPWGVDESGPAADLCVGHGLRRDEAGVCVGCGRADVPDITRRRVSA